MPPVIGPSDLLLAVLDEARLLFHRAAQLGEELHRQEPVSVAMRAVLEYLHRFGPSTVPAMAARRFVSRQHIQTLVNELRERRLVERRANPAHKRSSLVRLTAEGARTIERMQKREARVLAAVDLGLRPPELKAAALTLRRVREALGGTT